MNMGHTWTAILHPEPFRLPFLGYPERLVGGQWLAPERFYLAVNQDRRLGGSAVYRSDDGGATWTGVLVNGPSGASEKTSSANPGFPNLSEMALDPANPDIVYVGRQVFPTYAGPPEGGGVVTTLDGGTIWSELGQQDIGVVRDLGLDAANHVLYAATDQGVR